MNGQAQRLLPALLIALVLHGVLLTRQLREDRIMPVTKALQRITVSLGTRPVAGKQHPQKQQQPPSEEKKEYLSPPVKPIAGEYREPPVSAPITPLIHIPKPSRRKVVSHQRLVQSKPQAAVAPTAEQKNIPLAAPAQEGVPSSFAGEEEERGDPQVSSTAAVLQRAVPLYRINPPPEYPRLARRRGLEGTVLLEVLVDSSGRVADMRFSRTSGHALLDKAAMEGVQRWQFAPGTMNGRPQEMWVEIPVRFQLR